LIEKYKKHNLDLSQIETVDYVWNGEKISDLISERFKWVIASHLIEHTPDFIGFLTECENLLEKNGVISLAVPDKRYCFDHKRELTALSGVIDAIGNEIHTKGAVADYFVNVVMKNKEIAWSVNEKKDVFENVHSYIDAINAMDAVEGGEYLDIHAWVFTLETFLKIIKDLKALNFINLDVLDFDETDGHEFYVRLIKR